MIRGFLFTGVYYLLSFIYVVVCLPLLALPGRSAVTWVIRSYTRAVRFALRLVGGVGLEIRGNGKIPDGPFIIAAKHQSWGDGFLIYPQIENLAFVTGDHLEKFPFVGGILNKLGAIVIDTCGGGDRKAKSLSEGMNRAKAEGRRILIYPEGHLAPPGYHFRYKSGVWHMQNAMQVPVLPVATNLGCFWQQQNIRKRSGKAVLEFLDPIQPGLDKAQFIDRLTSVVETSSSHLIAEASHKAPTSSVLIPDPAKGSLAKTVTPAV